MLKYTAKTIVPPGQGLNLNLVPDEPIDVREDGTFATSAVVSGDSNAPDIKPTSNANSIDVLLRGDGSIGVKVVSVTVDASVGPADVPLTIEITYTVDHPNATDFKTVTEGTLEALP